MLILGFDQSVRHAGWCLYEWPGDERRMRCGTFGAPDSISDAEELCDFFGQSLFRLVGRTRPGFMVWERAKRQISAYGKKPGKTPMYGEDQHGPRTTVNADQLLLPEIQGQIRQIAIDYGIPYESVPTSTWRADIFGRGYGHMERAEAKEHAKQYCRRLGIKHANEHEAEASCIARWAATCSQRLKFHLFKHNVDKEAAAS